MMPAVLYAFSSEDIRLDVEAQNKNHLLGLLAGQAARCLQLPDREILDAPAA